MIVKLSTDDIKIHDATLHVMCNKIAEEKTIEFKYLCGKYQSKNLGQTNH